MTNYVLRNYSNMLFKTGVKNTYINTVCMADAHFQNLKILNKRV